MDLLSRIAQVIVPVFLIVAIGWFYGRRARPDMTVFNRITLDVLSPLLVYAALADRSFRLQDHGPLLLGGTLLMLGCGLLAWVVARAFRAQPRSLVPVVMFTNCGNMGLPLALLAFGPEHFGAAVALFSISNLLHFSLGMRITSAHAATRELLLSPLMLATALGFASALTGLRPPAMLLTGMKMLGDAMLPLMLFSLGVRLIALTRSGLALGLLGALARPLAGLAVVWPLVWLLDLQGAARGQLVLFAVLPPAVMQFLLAERYRQEPEKVAAMILLGNALSVLFVPLGLALGL
ncbi:AEC family transporter [Variovorax terrae]|uniref:AEC family transporter n=1 Tax=Variovorax terrae TaxID=2923278 RepID=A0A9X2APS2_9BURK|nr:AEC family transporter [Variovorax terrae]MCJ0763822.1 AEC family transporter [Variovorax terrae]